MFEIYLQNEQATTQLAKLFASVATFPLRMYFCGEIGAGKSHFIRVFLKEIGLTQTIKSPTFSVIETYLLGEDCIAHLDLYRISDEEEIEYLGFNELFDEAALLLIEWPEKVSGLPKPDLWFTLSWGNVGQEEPEFGEGRKISIQSNTCHGKKIIEQLSSLAIPE